VSKKLLGFCKPTGRFGKNEALCLACALIALPPRPPGPVGPHGSES